MPRKRKYGTRSHAHKLEIKKRKRAIENAPKVIFKIIPDLYSWRVTRSFSKMLYLKRDFIIVEIYRCMPLLGDEEKQAPDWTVHIVRYEIVFIDKQNNLSETNIHK